MWKISNYYPALGFELTTSHKGSTFVKMFLRLITNYKIASRQVKPNWNFSKFQISMYESFNVKNIQKDYLHHCPGLPLSILILGTFSKLLLSLGSALNFFMYCIMSPMFRRELGVLLTRALNVCQKNIGTGSSREDSPLTGRATMSTIIIRSDTKTITETNL